MLSQKAFVFHEFSIPHQGTRLIFPLSKLHFSSIVARMICQWSHWPGFNTLGAGCNATETLVLVLGSSPASHTHSETQNGRTQNPLGQCKCNGATRSLPDISLNLRVSICVVLSCGFNSISEPFPLIHATSWPNDGHYQHRQSSYPMCMH